MKRQYAVGHIHFLVDRMHVSVSKYSIMRDIARRAKSWPRAQLKLAIADALERHYENGSLYKDVMHTW